MRKIIPKSLLLLLLLFTVATLGEDDSKEYVVYYTRVVNYLDDINTTRQNVRDALKNAPKCETLEHRLYYATLFSTYLKQFELHRERWVSIDPPTKFARIHFTGTEALLLDIDAMNKLIEECNMMYAVFLINEATSKYDKVTIELKNFYLEYELKKIQ